MISLSTLETRVYRGVTTPEEETQTRYLAVELNRREFNLPMVNVGPKDGTPNWIAWFDPRIPELKEAGAEELARRFTHFEADLIVTPSSSKSIPMMQRAVEIVSENLGHQVETMILIRGEENEVRNEIGYDGGFTTEFQPVTSPDHKKHMGLSQEQYNMLRRYASDGKRIVLADDVYSTGETVGAMTKLVNIALSSSELLPTIVVVRECELDLQNPNTDWPPQEPPNIYSAIVTPVFIGLLPSPNIVTTL